MKRATPQARWLHIATLLIIFTGFSLALSLRAQAQGFGAPPAGTAGDAQAQAPQDLTGYWVSVVTEDWRYRMLVADPGDTQSVPLNPEGVRASKAWNPAKDQADRNAQCKAFGAAGLMRIPGRVHITWQDHNTLKVQTDSGTQTRLFHFGGEVTPANEKPSWQGYSLASWEGVPARRQRPGGRPAPGQQVNRDIEGYLQVNTTHLLPGYLRTNGVPYSANTRLLEYYDSFKEANGDVWLVVTTVVTDPEYLNQPFVTSTHFKKLADASGWDPTPCRADVPR